MSDTQQPVVTYTVGLDLAQMSDFTALAVLERRQERTRPPVGGARSQHLARLAL